MGSRVLVLALFAVLAAAPLRTGAAESVRPLRTLSFEVDVRMATLTETPGGAVNVRPPAVGGRARPGGARASATTTGSGESKVKRSFSAKGSITVEVLQTTDDAGLIVDIAEDASDRVRPKVRIGVATDGTLLYDPQNRKNVSEEELALVRWLARGFIGDHPTAPGTVWTVDQSGNGHTELEHYRVVQVDANRVTLDYSLDEKVPGVTGYEATRAGSLVYDTMLVVPLKVTFQTDSHRQVSGSYDTTRTSVALTLTADSFAKRTP